jgi:hypothetical protein
MKNKFSPLFFSLLAMGSASAAGLYFDGVDAKESSPLKWVVGSSIVYDDNISPGIGKEEESFALSPYVGLSVVNVTPQTTVDVYARLGLIYYLDGPDQTDDVQSSSTAGLNVNHQFNERLRLNSRNYISYESQPDYSQGFASAQQLGEYFYWQTDNSLGYRWTERLGTYTGFRLTGLNYSDVSDNDRFTWELYNQFRYSLSPQAVLTGDYRYAQTNTEGFASDSTDHYLLAGVEYRFSPTLIGVAKAGAQFHDVDGGEDSTSPYIELALNAQMNEQFSVQSFLRYGIENYDTVLVHPNSGLAIFDSRETLRFGVSASYALSQMVSLNGGIDYIPSSFNDGRLVNSSSGVSDLDEDLVNAFIGVSVKFNDCLTGNAGYNYTNSDSDVSSRDYDRNRISVGLTYQF